MQSPRVLSTNLLFMSFNYSTIKLIFVRIFLTKVACYAIKKTVKKHSILYRLPANSFLNASVYLFLHENN
jgi:hypothetical protein